MALFGLIGSTAKLKEQYAGQESATHRAERKRQEKEMARYRAGSPGRRARHRSHGIREAADAGNAWEERDRRRFGR